MRLLSPRSRFLSLALAAVLVAESVAFAQPKAADLRSQLPEDARRAWDAAKELADDGNFDGALVEYKRAQQISGDPRVGFNVGICEKSLKHYARAIDAWQRELDEGGSKLTPTEVTELKNAIEVVRRYVTSITVTANEPGATLFVDDRSAGTTPLPGPVRIDVGPHRLRLTKDGFAEATKDVDVATGSTPSVSLHLERSAALVTVTVEGASGASVVVDGSDRGLAPFKGMLAGGAHTIAASAPGFGTVAQHVDVASAQPMSVTLSLSAERHEGKLHVTAPEGTSLFLDGKSIGTGGWEGNVSSVGGHELVARKPGFQVYSTDVTVGPDALKQYDVQLNKETPTSWVVWGSGAVLLTAAFAIIGGLLVFKPANGSPFRGDLLPGLTSARYGLHF